MPDFAAKMLMSTPLIPPDLLKKSDKILFIAHLALGDFTYLQSSLQAFCRAYPHVKLHLWVDERRRTSRTAEWAHLKKYALYDWLAECRYIDKVYNRTYSPALFEQSIDEAVRQDYPIVVSLGVLERHKYATLARRISPRGFVVGQKNRVRPYDLPKRLIYRKLDAHIAAYNSVSHPGQHISDIYADWFAQLFGIEIPAASRFPFVDIPEKWMRHAREQFSTWGFSGTGSDAQSHSKVVFLNSFSKSAERSWPLERTLEMIQAMRGQDAWRGAGFVVNVVPEELGRARSLFAGRALDRVHLFSAEENFFQLPAILSLCDLIISVETAVMHLANAVHVPVIALMRQTNPEWVPLDQANSTVITASGRKDWVETIPVARVMETLSQQSEVPAPRMA